MHRLRISVLLLCLCHPAIADVDPHSKFWQARQAASELDLALAMAERSWWEAYVVNPSQEVRRQSPLVAAVGAAVNLAYRGDDKINVSFWITDIQAFTDLTVSDRKALLYQALDLIQDLLFMDATIVDKDSGQFNGEQLRTQDFEVNVILNKPQMDTKGRSVRFLLPFDLGVGVAGYSNGQYVFSRDYYLSLEVENGLAKAGSLSAFVIEKE